MDEIMKEPIVVSGFLKQDEISHLSAMGKILMRSNKHFFDYQDGASTSYYSHPAIEALLITKLEIMKDATKKNLAPGYSYFRIYNKYAYLKEHIDRPTCEWSVTVFVDSCGTCDWPIKMDGKDYFLKKGDAIIYRGCDWKHSRDEYLGDWHFQCFLHFVDMDGPYKHLIFDGRKTLGDSKDFV